MLRLALRTGGRRIAALFAMACATFGGAALVTGTGVLAESGLHAHVPAGRLAGADLLIAADQAYHQPDELPVGLPERALISVDLVARLAQLPGVTAAVGDVSFPAAVLDGAGQPVPSSDPRVAGHAWSSTALLDRPGIDGIAPAGPDEVALDAASGAQVGNRVRIVAAGITRDYRVTAIVTAPNTGVLFADPTATEFAARNRAGRSGVDLVGLRISGNADAVRQAVAGSGLVIASGTDRGDVETPGAAPARSVLLLVAGSLAGITLLIVGFIVAGAMAVSIGGQRRELALLRAVGATPRQVRRLAALQATTVTVAALVPGIALGYVLAEWLRRLLVHIGLLPGQLPLARGPLPAVAAGLLLLAVVQLAARAAAWRTSVRPATEAVAESRSEPRSPSRIRTGAGLLLTAAGAVLAGGPLAAPTQAGAALSSIAGLTMAIGLALAGPDLVRRAGAALARHLPERVSAPTWLAVSNSHGYALRIGGAVATLAMAVIFVLTYTLSQTTLAAAVSADLHAGTRADVALSSPALGGLPDDVLPAVRAIDGVAAAPVDTTTVLWPSTLPGDRTFAATTALVLTPDAPSIVDLDVSAGTLADLTGAAIAVDAATASAQRLKVGSPADLVLGDGTTTIARVVAIYRRGLGFGPVVLSHDLVAGHVGTGLTQTILLRTDGDAGTIAALNALAATHPGLVVDTATTAPGGLGGPPPEVWLNLAVLAILLGYLLLGIANKLIAATAARRAELAALRLIGTTPRQLRAMMRREAALVTVYALGSGTLLASLPLALLGIGFLHQPWAAGPVWLLPAIAVVVAGIAFLATEIPTRYALRSAPTQALALRE